MLSCSHVLWPFRTKKAGNPTRHHTLGSWIRHLPAPHVVVVVLRLKLTTFTSYVAPNIFLHNTCIYLYLQITYVSVLFCVPLAMAWRGKYRTSGLQTITCSWHVAIRPPFKTKKQIGNKQISKEHSFHPNKALEHAMSLSTCWSWDWSIDCSVLCVVGLRRSLLSGLSTFSLPYCCLFPSSQALCEYLKLCSCISLTESFASVQKKYVVEAFAESCTS